MASITPPPHASLISPLHPFAAQPGTTPLHVAIVRGQHEIVKVLVDAGAKLNAVDQVSERERLMMDEGKIRIL